MVELYLKPLRQDHPRTAEALALIQQYIHCHCQANRQKQQSDQIWQYFRQSLLLFYEISERAIARYHVFVDHFQRLEDSEDKQWHHILEHQALSARFSRIVRIGP